MPIFVDTNVLVYARDASDPQKHRKAFAWMEHLWGTGSGRLSVQVLEEYYVTVTRKLQPGLPRHAARSEMEDLSAWRPLPVDERVLAAAWVVEDRFGLSFWDALIVGAAGLAGCEHLLSEDLQHGMRLGAVTVVDPFQVEPGALT